jgi:hypothetical protein
MFAAGSVTSEVFRDDLCSRQRVVSEHPATSGRGYRKNTIYQKHTASCFLFNCKTGIKSSLEITADCCHELTQKSPLADTELPSAEFFATLFF